jgi:poly(A) polymerase
MQTVADALANLESSTSSPILSKLGEKFVAAGFEIALVGGPVRDAFLGRISPDLDFTTNAYPDDILKILKGWATNTWDVGREFGTIAATIEGEQVEITTYRADSYDKKTRKPTVEFGDDLESDLIRRDFAVNSMALRLPERVFVDPHGGLQDLLDKKLKTPTDPEISFSDDPLRMMRACRFAADELTKLLLSDQPRLGLTALVDSGLADLVLPELPALKLEADEHHHHKDVYQHTLTVLEQAIDYEADYGFEKDLISRMAALLHDIGKPATRRLEPGGAVTFYHHDIVGSKLAKKRLKELRFDNDTIKAVSLLIELHLRFFGYSDQQWSDSAVRRYVRDAGEQLTRLHILTRSDVTTRNKRKAERLSFAYDDLEKRIAEISEKEELNSMRPDLNGEQIMQILEIEAGPEVGKAYKYLLELRIENGPLGEQEAKKRLLEWWSAR